MKLLLTGKIITGLASEGTYIGAVEVPDSIIPEGFYDDFEPHKWMYIKGKIIPNPSFVPSPEPVPTLEDRVKELTEQNQMLTDCILEMSEIIYGGN